jgi:hypothetical protein
LEGCQVSNGFRDISPVDITEWILAIFQVWSYCKDEFMDDGTIREKYAEDAPFVRRRRDRPSPLFCIGHDVFAGYFLAVCPAVGDLRPF